ncbi:MAG: hypothetical protein SFY32_01325 [Bacteroidota bacterium]|nr:hypothetical protein [Bacteroidota bacterium]
MSISLTTCKFFVFLILFVHADFAISQKRFSLRIKKNARLLAIPSDKLLSNSSKKSRKNNTEGYTVARKTQRADDQDHNKLASHRVKTVPLWIVIRNTFCKKCKESKTDCPDITNRKAADSDDNVAQSVSTKANLIRSTYSVNFDVIELDDIHLDIPAFKQFKNNMTDFTADGEHEFHNIIEKIGVFLGTNYEGKGVTLKIMGSASQIPTSFDPHLPNNNINPDGSSIIGQTSIANNVKLAKARADELAKKIKQVFPSLQIITPSLDDIELGPTVWTKEHQLELSKCFAKKDKAGMEKVYEPFQKDQWVKVESQGRSSKSIKPESLKMYMVSTTPNLKALINDQETVIRSVFIISKKTYEMIGDNHMFNSPIDRDDFIDKMGLKIFYQVKNGNMRWYMLNGIDEINAFKINDYNEKVYRLYELGIIDSMDEQILEDKIVADLRPKQ